MRLIGKLNIARVLYKKQWRNDYIDTEERKKYQYFLIYKYLERKVDGDSICNMLIQNDVDSVSIYAITDIGWLLLRDIHNHEPRIKIVGVFDKSPQKMDESDFFGYKVRDLEEMVSMYKEGKIKNIIMCSIFHENEAMNDLMNKGIRQEDIISVIDLIYY